MLCDAWSRFRPRILASSASAYWTTRVIRADATLSRMSAHLRSYGFFSSSAERAATSTGLASRLLVASVSSSPQPAANAPQAMTAISVLRLLMVQPPGSSLDLHRLSDPLRRDPRPPREPAGRLGGLRLDEVQEELVG